MRNNSQRPRYAPAVRRRAIIQALKATNELTDLAWSVITGLSIGLLFTLALIYFATINTPY